MCGESWLATPPQFSRLSIQVSLAIYFLFVWAMVGWVTSPFFSFLFLKARLSVLCTCISMYIHLYSMF